MNLESLDQLERRFKSIFEIILHVKHVSRVVLFVSFYERSALDAHHYSLPSFQIVVP